MKTDLFAEAPAVSRPACGGRHGSSDLLISGRAWECHVAGPASLSAQKRREMLLRVQTTQHSGIDYITSR